jgi:hypothetical protein
MSSNDIHDTTPPSDWRHFVGALSTSPAFERKTSNIAIVDQPFSVDETEQPFGKRWGGECYTLTPEHLAALQAGKTLALDVQNEYVTFVRLQPVVAAKDAA